MRFGLAIAAVGVLMLLGRRRIAPYSGGIWKRPHTPEQVHFAAGWWGVIGFFLMVMGVLNALD